MQILVLHPGALGDLILSLPALELLKRQSPGARITLAANLDYLCIVPNSLVERRLSLSALPLSGLFGVSPPPVERGFWISFDRVLSWTGFGDEQFAANLKALHGEALVAHWRPARDERRHVSRLFADSLAPWIPVQEDPPTVKLTAGDSQLSSAGDWFSQRGVAPETVVIALQPGAGSPSKRWPLDHFIQLSRMLLEDYCDRVLIIEGPAETGLGGRMMEALPVSNLLIANCLRLDDLAALLSKCRAYVGNDSGISHLAAGLGIPCIVLFGPTSPRQWSPLGRRVAVLRNIAGCKACEAGGVESHRCLRNIPPADVCRLLAGRLIHEQAAIDFDAFPDNV